MQPTEKRLRNCVACQGWVPAGSRIDRKYCSQACITRAYYQRHPEKKRVLLTRTRQNSDPEAPRPRRSDSLQLKLERLESDNAALQRGLEAAHAQIEELKAAQATNEARAKDVLTEVNRRLAELERQLKAETLRADRAEMAREHISTKQRVPEQAHQHTSAAIDGPHRPQTNAHSMVTGAKHQDPQPSPPTGSLALQQRNAAAAARQPHLWEFPPQQQGQPPVPKWRGWKSVSFREMRAFSVKAMEGIPREIYKQGDRRWSEGMRTWLMAPDNVEILKELSFRIVLRVVCTDPPYRQTQSQKETLAVLALQCAIESMGEDRPADFEEIRNLMSAAQRGFSQLAIGLVHACRDKGLKYD